MTITFNEAIELKSMKNDKPDKWILSNESIGWKKSKGSGIWDSNTTWITINTAVDPLNLGLNATRL